MARKSNKRKKFGFFSFLLYTLVFLVIVGLIGGAIAFKKVKSIIDETEPISDYNIETLLAENSYLYDKDGNFIENIQSNYVRTIVSYDQIDQDIIDAFVAIEDKTFFEHNGFNYVRLIGSIVEAIKTGSDPKGTSTITQQYARNMYLPDSKFERSYVRKIREAYYTMQIEEHLDKKQIITAYLNTIDLGANVQGVQAAAKRYFSKDANDLDYIEAAILAGIPKANSTYSPFINILAQDVTEDMIILGDHDDEMKIVFNEKMIPRFKTVINAMRVNGKIDQAEADYAIEYAESKQIIERFKPGSFVNENITSYFSDMVKEDVIQSLMKELNLSEEDATRKLYGGGLRIYSTLDLNIQRILEKYYNSLPFAPEFDETMRKAVVAFQEKHGIDPIGIIGPQTLAKMSELQLIDPTQITGESYQVGSAGEDVVLLKEGLEKEGLLFRKNENLPQCIAYRDENKNILGLKDNVYKTIIGSKIILSYYDLVIGGDGAYVIQNGDYQVADNGDIKLLKNKSLNFYNVTNPDGTSGIEIFLKDAYKVNEDDVKRVRGAAKFYSEKVSIQELYIFKGGNIEVPFQYKKFDDDKNLIISKDFLAQNDDFYSIDENGNLRIAKDYYSIAKTGIIQPQSAMLVIDYRNGELRAIVGGRNVSGKKIYNRAINPRQPGSTIKPLGVYTPALDNGITAATVFDDVPRYTASGRRWPQNYFEYSAIKHKGIMTAREALHDSNNVVAVKVADRIGVENCIPYLERFGISTLVTEGDVNDVNLAACALGGMTRGITPLDLTTAYGALANGGIRNETITFTKITDKEGNLVLERKPEKTYVVDEQVAYLMQHMLETGGKYGHSKQAVLRPGNVGMPIAGKTGTTSNKNDAWFVGYSQYYVAGMWIGNDIQVSLSKGSYSAANFWQKIMIDVHEGLEDKSFKTPQEAGLIAMTVDNKSGKIPTPLSYADPQGGNIITEYFIPGTQPTEKDDVHVEVTICSESQKLATEFCPARTHETRVYRTRLDEDYDPNAHGHHYAIGDEEFTIPKSYIMKDEDESGASKADSVKDGTYCFIHTSEPWTAQRTVDLLYGVPVVIDNNGNYVITVSMIVYNIYDVPFKVDAGSLIDQNGTITAYDMTNTATANTFIYPWQIKSAEPNPDGPIYNPPTSEPPTSSSTETELSSDNPLLETTSEAEEDYTRIVTITRTESNDD